MTFVPWNKTVVSSSGAARVDLYCALEIKWKTLLKEVIIWLACFDSD